MAFGQGKRIAENSTWLLITVIQATDLIWSFDAHHGSVEMLFGTVDDHYNGR